MNPMPQTQVNPGMSPNMHPNPNPNMINPNMQSPNPYPYSHPPFNQPPKAHSQYEPFSWIFYLRVAQLVLSILVIALAGYAASQSAFQAGPILSCWTIVWTVVYVPCTVYAIPKMPARYRPNIIVLVLECLSWFWWLVTFGTLAAFASVYWLIVATAATTDDFASSYYGGSYGVSDGDNFNYSGAVAGDGCIKAATAFAAINYVLFKATFIATCIRIHRQRKERLAEHFHRGLEAGVQAHGAAVEINQMNMNDKSAMHVQTQEVRY